MQEEIEKIFRTVEKVKKENGLTQEVTVVAATKMVEAERINLLPSFGITIAGENRVQELLEKFDKVSGLSWHIIGALQTNKVKYIIDKVKLIHSLDSLTLAKEIDKQARKHSIKVDVLVEINSGVEASKGGVMPHEVEAFCEEIATLEGINLRGFMTMAPKCEKNSEYLKYFCETYQLVLDIWQKKGHNVYGLILSMGMSDSFVPAAQAGATMVRIGRKMFIKN